MSLSRPVALPPQFSRVRSAAGQRVPQAPHGAPAALEWLLPEHARRLTRFHVSGGSRAIDAATTARPRPACSGRPQRIEHPTLSVPMCSAHNRGRFQQPNEERDATRELRHEDVLVLGVGSAAHGTETVEDRRTDRGADSCHWSHRRDLCRVRSRVRARPHTRADPPPYDCLHRGKDQSSQCVAGRRTDQPTPRADRTHAGECES